MQVEHISTLDRLIATRQIAEIAGNDLIVQNLDIAINDLNEINNAIGKLLNSEFKCKEENTNVAS